LKGESVMNFHIKKGTPPGTLVYTGNSSQPTTITHIQYSENRLLIHEELKSFSTNEVDWVNVEGLSDTDRIKQMCIDLGVDNLTIEDILNTNQRNKFEIFSTHIFFVIKYYYLDNNNDILEDYFSILLFKDKIITFSESVNRFKNDIINRLQDKALQITKLHEDYLFYVIYDMIVDEEWNTFQFLNLNLEQLEGKILRLNKDDQINLYNVRKHLVFIKNQTQNSLDFATPKSLLHNELFNTYLKKYLNDLQDHLMNLNEKAKTGLEEVNNLYEVYSNNVSNKSNEIMKTLTIFSAIFIPLSFIAGIFGMNFINFPILKNQYGLLIFGIICILIPVIMLLYFKIKKWF
jgi:magnesium transporter